MLSSSSPGLNRLSPSCSSINTICRHSSRNRGFSKWPKTLQVEEQKQLKRKLSHTLTHTQKNWLAYLTFFSIYRTSEGRFELCTSNSVRSASSREGGGSLGCRVGGSLRILRILSEGEKQTNMYFKNKTLISQKALNTQNIKMCSFVILASYVQNFGSFSYALWLLWWRGMGWRRKWGECLNLQNNIQIYFVYCTQKKNFIQSCTST